MKLLSRIAAAVAMATLTLHAAAPDKLSGFSETVRIGALLFNALEPSQQAGLAPQPVALETENTPYVLAGQFEYNGRPLRVVTVSTGFIELMNRVARARAFDAVQPGYLERYLSVLASTSPTEALPALPDADNPKFGHEDVVNNQRTYFAQMVSMVVAIELSHQYLGHYAKYSGQLAGKTPIAAVMKKGDWQKAVEAGAENSLNVGYGPESVSVFYGALERMKQRPAWAAYFLPPDENVKRLSTKLAKIEKSFFNLR
jgi:hypothetical protein